MYTLIWKKLVNRKVYLLIKSIQEFMTKESPSGMETEMESEIAIENALVTPDH